jgi:hypothetical protein
LAEERPKRRSDLNARVVDGEMVVLDRRSERIHQLNQTACFIWDRCDGDRSLEQIADGMIEAFEVDEETATRDVVATVKQFAELGLLEGRP